MENLENKNSEIPQSQTDGNAVLADSFFRPKTMAELLDALKKGVKCEVANSGFEIVNIKLDGWLNFAGKYRTLYSPNKGYIIYEAV